MYDIRLALMGLAAADTEVASSVTPLTRQADKWQSLPKGWTDESRKKFWETLTGDNKHKVTKCIKEMSKGDKDIDNPGAFCAALADRVMGPEWRKKKEAAGPVKVEPWWRNPGGELVWTLYHTTGTRWTKATTKTPGVRGMSSRVLTARTYEWLSERGVIETDPAILARNEMPALVRLTPEGVKAAKAMKPWYDEQAAINKAHKALKDLVDGLARKYPEAGLTFGYLGNVGSYGDDRSWYFFSKLSKPGSGGHKDIKWGGYSTHRLPELYAKYKTLLGGLVAQAVASNDGPYKGPAPYPRWASRRAALNHGQAMGKLQREFSDVPPGELQDIVHSVSPRMSPDAVKIQDRYWELRGGRPGPVPGEWVPPRRRRWAAHEQTPNAIDGAAARFKDHLDLKVNEHYRIAFPAEVPPTLNLLYGNDFIRVVKADGGLTREAVAFIARSTGNVYLAASWDRPQPFVIANVADTSSWRELRVAFNKYNAPEVMGQLMALLKKFDLEEPLDLLTKYKVPQSVDTAWKNRDKRAACNRVAARYLHASAQKRQAADIRKVLSELFTRHKPYVKNWGRFLKDLTGFFREADWEQTESEGPVVETFKGVEEGWENYVGEQIGGGYWDPPEYAEADVPVADAISLVASVTYDLRKLKRSFYQYFKSDITDKRGFDQATQDLFASQSAMNMFGKLLSSSFYKALKDPDMDYAEWWLDDINAYVQGQVDHEGWGVSYTYAPGKAKFKRPVFKATGKGIKILSEGYVPLVAEVESEPEPNY